MKATNTLANTDKGTDIAFGNKVAENTGYDDLQGNISTSRKIIGTTPAERGHTYGIAGGVEFLTTGFAIGESVQLTVQTTHSSKLFSIVDEHIHFTTPTDGTGKRFKFQLDVIYAPVFGTWQAPVGSPYSMEVLMGESLLGKHWLEDIAQIPPVNSGVSTLYKMILTRVAASADEYGEEVYVDFIDGHIKIDQPKGSETEGEKVITE